MKLVERKTLCCYGDWGFGFNEQQKGFHVFPEAGVGSAGF